MTYQRITPEWLAAKKAADPDCVFIISPRIYTEAELLAKLDAEANAVPVKVNRTPFRGAGKNGVLFRFMLAEGQR